MSEVGLFGGEVSVLWEVDHVLSLTELSPTRAADACMVVFSGSALVVSDDHTATIKKIKRKDGFDQIYTLTEAAGRCQPCWHFWHAIQ